MGRSLSLAQGRCNIPVDPIVLQVVQAGGVLGFATLVYLELRVMRADIAKLTVAIATDIERRRRDRSQ